MKVLETERLVLRWLTINDAPFILRLLNDPAWLKYIGDRGVQDLATAETYIEKSPMAMYQTHGFGLFLVELKESLTPIGLCGLIKRESLPDVDLGFAFMPAFRQKGYAYEAASATLDYAQTTHQLSRIVAITLPQNHASSGLLKKLGFHYEDNIRWQEDGELLELYAMERA